MMCSKYGVGSDTHPDHALDRLDRSTRRVTAHRLFQLRDTSLYFSLLTLPETKQVDRYPNYWASVSTRTPLVVFAAVGRSVSKLNVSILGLCSGVRIDQTDGGLFTTGSLQ